MNLFLMKMQKKFGKYAIPNLPLIIVIVYGLGFLMNNIFGPEIWASAVSLNPYAILHGQVWRLFSWVFVPEETNIFFILIVLYFYYSLGRTLEKTWGSFMFNLYFFSGLIITIVGAFVLSGILMVFGKEWLVDMESMLVYMNGGVECPFIRGGSYIHETISLSFGMYYITLSIFLAFAMMYPDMKVYLFFIIPIKVKVMGIIYLIMLGFGIITSFITVRGGVATIHWQIGMIQLVSVGASLLNTFIFFLLTRRGIRKTPKEIKRQHEYKVKVKKAVPASRHKCEICGVTDEGNDNITFRYCSKCSGSHEYCQEHLFTHTHIK